MAESGPSKPPKPPEKKSGIIPPLTALEGVAKVLLGTAAGALLLYAIWKSIETRQPVQEETLYALGTLVMAFLGVDLWAIIQRGRNGGNG